MKPKARSCQHCGKTSGSIWAFVHPVTKKPGYWHLKCFRIVKKEQ